MAKKSKKKPSQKIIPRLLVFGILAAGYFFYQHPEALMSIGKNLPMIASTKSSSNPTTPNQVNISSILGKTTSLVEEGLANMKVPKQLTGTDDQIVLEEVFDQFTQKVKDLPNQQVDRIKVQFCQDLLEPIPNASVEISDQ